METAPCAQESPLSGRRQNLARDLNSAEVIIRRKAEERFPGFLHEAFKEANAVLHHRQDAQDVVSDALTSWLENPSKYNENYKASDLTWFKTVVRNASIDLLRRRYLERRPLPAVDGEDPLPEMLELLYEALNAVSAPDQRILREYLKWNDAPNPNRIGVRLGKALGISDKQAKARFTAAVVALRREMLKLVAVSDRHGETARSRGAGQHGASK